LQGWANNLAPGPLRKRPRLADRWTYLAVLSSLRQMFSSRQRTAGHRKNRSSRQVPSGGLAAGRTF